jgi:hypothetical protein
MRSVLPDLLAAPTARGRVGATRSVSPTISDLGAMAVWLTWLEWRVTRRGIYA